MQYWQTSARRSLCPAVRCSSTCSSGRCAAIELDLSEEWFSLPAWSLCAKKHFPTTSPCFISNKQHLQLFICENVRHLSLIVDIWLSVTLWWSFKDMVTSVYRCETMKSPLLHDKLWQLRNTSEKKLKYTWSRSWANQQGAQPEFIVVSICGHFQFRLLTFGLYGQRVWSDCKGRIKSIRPVTKRQWKRFGLIVVKQSTSLLHYCSVVC